MNRALPLRLAQFATPLELQDSIRCAMWLADTFDALWPGEVVA
jgi:hypothetical protein